MNYPFVDGDVPRSTSYGINTRDKVLTANLLKEGYSYHKILLSVHTPFFVIIMISLFNKH